MYPCIRTTEQCSHSQHITLCTTTVAGRAVPRTGKIERKKTSPIQAAHSEKCEDKFVENSHAEPSASSKVYCTIPQQHHKRYSVKVAGKKM
jgi:hypothetical protein